jgi:hypothetical protein
MHKEIMVYKCTGILFSLRWKLTIDMLYEWNSNHYAK